MTGGLYWSLTALLVLTLIATAVWALQTANRLNRLHIRCDLSWQALDAALGRRAVVARAVAVDAYGERPEGRRLVVTADSAEQAPRSTREACENELSTALATVDPARVPLARRFYNDAVRDTLALRERRPVRWLKLGGRAALPSYFEIAELAQR